MRASEITTKPHLYLDMDGVQADFFSAWARLHGKERYKEIGDKQAREQSIDDLNARGAEFAEHFFKTLPPLPGGQKLIRWLNANKIPFTVLSAPLRGNEEASVAGKRYWLNKHNPGSESTAVFTDKKQLLAQRNGQPNVLVDDFKKYIQAWSEAGGIPILYRDANVDSVIAQLAEIYGVDQESQPVTEDTSSAERFIHDVYAEYPQMWQNNHVMPFSEEEFAMFELKPSIKPNAVDVYWFQAWPQRQGIGSRAMKVLQDKAREYGVGLTLITWDKGRVSQAALTKFYKRAGFKQDVKGSRKMSWDPQSVKESKETRQALSDQHFEFPQQGQYGYRTGYRGSGVLEVADGRTGEIINLGEFGTFNDEYKPNQKWLRIVFTNPNMDDNAWDELEDMLWSDNQIDEDFADSEENKSVTIHTNPNYRGATIGAGVKEQLPVTKMPIDELHMWENNKTLRTKAVRDWVRNTLIPKLQDKGRLMPMIVWNRKGKYFVIDGNHRFLAYKAAGFKGDVPVKIVPQEMIAMNNKVLEPVDENFADGKKPGRKGLAKRVGVDCKQSVAKLRSIAKNSTGERQRMAHWCANMKSGRKK